MTVTAARSTLGHRVALAARAAAVAALSPPPGRFSLAAVSRPRPPHPHARRARPVELTPAGALATQCYYRVNATGGLVIRSGPGTTYTRVGSYPNGATVLALASTTNGFRNVGTNRWVSCGVPRPHHQLSLRMTRTLRRARS
ncbi:hypothetical protein SMICM17S_11755 [Streptomyces microflavus]